MQYKQFLSQAKMKVLKPELDAIREKHKDNKMKAQQETMALQNKAGASPMAGCLPALIQMPVFYALFMFFPIAFASHALTLTACRWSSIAGSSLTVLHQRWLFGWHFWLHLRHLILDLSLKCSVPHVFTGQPPASKQSWVLHTGWP